MTIVIGTAETPCDVDFAIEVWVVNGKLMGVDSNYRAYRSKKSGSSFLALIHKAIGTMLDTLTVLLVHLLDFEDIFSILKNVIIKFVPTRHCHYLGAGKSG